jgi:uncharacterized protein with PQ loop repeat
MPELSLHNIEQISRDIGRQEITFSHLLEDLIDHVCCDVENEMKKGLSFNEAYNAVKKKLGSRRLKEIQEETLYLVDTKYRNMKNTMKISGVAGTIMLGFAALLKIQHWPGAGIMLNLGALILAFAFLPSALSVLWKETHNSKKLFLFISAFFAGIFFIFGVVFKIQHWPGAGIILSLAALSGVLFFVPALALSRLTDQENRAKRPVYILGALGMIFYAIGMLFKIQHWPLASMFMITGMILLCFLAFPIFTWITWKDESHISSTFIFLVIGFLLIVIPGTMVNLNLQHSYQDYYYPNNDQQNALYNYLFRNNSSIINSYNNSINYPKMEQLHSRTIEILASIRNIQEKMVQESERHPGQPAVSAGQIKDGQEILYRNLSNPFDPGPPKNFLLSGCNSRIELNSSMTEYVTYLASITRAEDMLRYKKMLDTETILPEGTLEKGKMSLMSALHSLEIMKNGILTVESCVLTEISKN